MLLASSTEHISYQQKQIIAVQMGLERT